MWFNGSQTINYILLHRPTGYVESVWRSKTRNILPILLYALMIFLAVLHYTACQHVESGEVCLQLYERCHFGLMHLFLSRIRNNLTLGPFHRCVNNLVGRKLDAYPSLKMSASLRKAELMRMGKGYFWKSLGKSTTASHCSPIFPDRNPGHRTMRAVTN